MATAAEILKRFERLKTQRQVYEGVWDEITEFVMPYRGDFGIRRSPGQRRDRRLFDTTAVQSNEFLASTLHGGLTNPSVEWFNLKSKDPVVNEIEPIKQFLEISTNLIFDILNSPRSNFQSQNHELFLDLVSYGTACMFIEEIPGEGITFKAVHLSEIYLAEDKRGHVDTVFRKFRFTARQAAQFWGPENLPTRMREALKERPDKRFDIIHCVRPNEGFEKDSRQSIKLPFVSYYVAVEDKVIIEVGGFHEMPYVVPRWSKVVGELYGNSPAWSAMADIRLINVISRTLLVATEKAVEPPLLMADDGVMLPLRTMPGGINFGGLDINGQARIQPLPGPGRIDIGERMLESRAKAIRNAYFIDPLLLREGPQMTATEVLQRQEEKLRLIGPQIGRIQTEYLNLLIERLYGILQRNGSLPELDDEIAALIESGGLEVEYTAPLARTQRGAEPIALQRTMELLTPLAQIDPTILDNFNPDRIARNMSEILGLPLSNLNTISEREEVRQARAQQQQQQQQMELLNEGAQRVAELTKAGVFDEGE